MKTIKIIDLLNKIANGEEVPEKIKFRRQEYTFVGGSYEDINKEDILRNWWTCGSVLNDTVEIIEDIEVLVEENEITKINCYGTDDRYLVIKINELVDAVNELKRGA